VKGCKVAAQGSDAESCTVEMFEGNECKGAAVARTEGWKVGRLEGERERRKSEGQSCKRSHGEILKGDRCWASEVGCGEVKGVRRCAKF